MTAQLGASALNLLIALALGAVIGFERQWRQRLAGLRTNTLVALGAASFVVFEGLHPASSSPLQVAAQVVSGIGFLGAGIIFREGLNVRGLNTAATLWCSAAVGVLAGAGAWWQAAMATVLIVGVNLLLRPLVRHISRQPQFSVELPSAYHISVVCNADVGTHVRTLLLNGVTLAGLQLRGLNSSHIEQSDDLNVSAFVAAEGRPDAVVEQIVRQVSSEPNVSAVSWRVEALSE